MKKHILLLTIVLASCIQLNAQTKRDWGEVYLTLNNGLLITSKNLHLNNQIFYLPSITWGVDVRLFRELIAYTDMQVQLSNTHPLKNNINLFGELSENNNLILLNKDRDNEFITCYTYGLAYRIYSKNWRLVPQIGFGMIYFTNAKTSYLLKEVGTNNIYDAHYTLISNNNSDDTTIQYLQFRCKAQKKISRRFSLNFSAGYNFYIDKLKFSGTFNDYYTHKTLKSVSVKKRPHELNFSVGLGFR